MSWNLIASKLSLFAYRNSYLNSLTIFSLKTSFFLSIICYTSFFFPLPFHQLATETYFPGLGHHTDPFHSFHFYLNWQINSLEIWALHFKIYQSNVGTCSHFHCGTHSVCLLEELASFLFMNGSLLPILRVKKDASFSKLAIIW